MSDLAEKVKMLYAQFGPGKPIGGSALSTRMPHYFLHRNFLGEQDLLIIFNTKRCRYQCAFCDLPLKSSKTWISGEDILSQFDFVISEVKHSLSVFDRITISNEGSVLDETTFPVAALITIAKCTSHLKNLRRIVLETRIEFVNRAVIRDLKAANPKAVVDILTGFETVDPYIRDELLYKRESLEQFLAGMDKVAECGAEMTAYVLFKPSYEMTDEEAVAEAEASIDFLVAETRRRRIPLTIRLGPMYAAARSKWAKRAFATPDYQPPRLTDVIELVEKKRQEGINIYIGLSTEGLADDKNSYLYREDYSKELLKRAISMNYGKHPVS